MLEPVFFVSASVVSAGWRAVVEAEMFPAGIGWQRA